MRFVFAISWLIVIALLHAVTGNEIPKYDFLDWLHLDKLAHAFMFMVAFILLVHAVQKQYKQSFYRYIILALAIYGLALEYSQEYFFENRSMDVMDWLADSCGILIGLVLFRKIPISTTTKSAKKV